jgi:hypothetical protein
MANYRAIATGNWSNGATWAGGAVPPNEAGHNIYSNNFTVTIDTNVNVALITNAAISASFVGGGASAAVGGGFVASNGITLTSNVTQGATQNYAFSLTGSNSASITGNITGTSNSPGAGNLAAVLISTTGTLTVTGNVIGGLTTSGYGANGINVLNGTLNFYGNALGGTGGNGANNNCNGINSTSTGVINVFGNLSGNSTGITGTLGIGARAVQMSGASTLTVVGNCTAGTGDSNNAIFSSNAAASINVTGDVTAANGINAIVATGNGTTVISGSLISSIDGTQPVFCSRYRVTPAPLNARTRYAANGSGSYVDMFTADNNLGQANPTNVRSGVSYASGNLTGRLTVPARGSVALNVNYGPSMPFTATCAGTTATATLAYSYPLVVGDQITVTGASNTEWNSTYTIASVVSETSVTFTVPATHSATAGTGATMQTTGTAVLNPAAVASAVWGAATRTLTAGGGISASDVWDYATRSLTTSSGPTAVQIRQEMDSNSTKLANLDATVSSRLAPSGTLATVTTLTNAPSVPSASAIATAVWAAADKTGYSLTSAERTAIATAVEASLINENDGQAIVNAIVNAIGNTNLSQVALVAAIRSDLATELGRIDAAISSRSVPSDIPTESEIAAEVWAKPTTELTITGSIGERAKNQSTVSTTGAQLAAALS